MNWGKKILLLYLAFVGLIVALMITCFGSETELEYSDYYKRELNFQQQIDATSNANALLAPIEYSVQKDIIEIKIPSELLNDALNGSIRFLRPSDSKLDKTIALSIDQNGIQRIAIDRFKKGAYKMSISVESNNKEYFKEAIINLH